MKVINPRDASIRKFLTEKIVKMTLISKTADDKCTFISKGEKISGENRKSIFSTYFLPF